MQRFRNRRRSINVITGNHNRTDACLSALSNRRLHLFTYRIHHTAQTEKYQIGFCCFHVQFHMITPFAGSTEYTQSLIGHLLIHLPQCFAILFPHRFYFLISPYSRAALQDHIHCPLGKLQNNTVRLPVHRGHHLPLRIKRIFMDTRILPYFLIDM